MNYYLWTEYTWETNTRYIAQVIEIQNQITNRLKIFAAIII